jgi:hypothetical protein
MENPRPLPVSLQRVVGFEMDFHNQLFDIFDKEPGKQQLSDCVLLGQVVDVDCEHVNERRGTVKVLQHLVDGPNRFQVASVLCFVA